MASLLDTFTSNQSVMPTSSPRKTRVDISVVICAYTEKRWYTLMEVVHSLHKQTVAPLEIIIVIDHNPALYERAKAEFSRETVLESQQEQGLSGARNTGLLYSRGAIIAFLDDDAVAAPDWIEQLQATYASSDVLGTGGMIEPKWANDVRPCWFPEEFLWAYGCSYRGLPKEEKAIRNPIGANMSFRREAFSVVGGFHNDIGRKSTGLLGSEEVELSIRLSQHLSNKQIVYQPQAKVYHHVSAERTTWKYFLRRCFYEGISKAMVSYLAGNSSLGNEVQYTFYILPTGILRAVGQAVRERQIKYLGVIFAIIFGLLATSLGFFWTKIKRTTVSSRSEELASMAQANAAVGTSRIQRADDVAAALYLLSNEAVQLANSQTIDHYQDKVDILHDAYQHILSIPTDNPLDQRLQEQHRKNQDFYWGTIEEHIKRSFVHMLPTVRREPSGSYRL